MALTTEHRRIADRLGFHYHDFDHAANSTGERQDSARRRIEAAIGFSVTDWAVFEGEMERHGLISPEEADYLRR